MDGLIKDKGGKRSSTHPQPVHVLDVFQSHVDA